MKNSNFSKGVNLWFWSKNGHFFKLSFLRNIGQQNVSYDILELKNAFLGYKNKKFKKLKNWHFSKGVNPWVWSKHGHVLKLFFLINISQEKVFYDILERKTPFKDIKTKRSKSRKIDIFRKWLTHGFCLKMAIFEPFLLRQYRQGKCLLRYSSTKKRHFYAIKTRSSKSRKIDIFPKGLTHAFSQKLAVFQPFLLWQYRPGKCLLRYSRAKKRLSRL